MKQEFSKNWIKSKQPRKQRKYRLNAPLHIKQNFLHAPLSKELRQKSGMRSFTVKTGDKVKVVRGQHKGTLAKVERVSLKTSSVYISGIEALKKDGSKSMYPINVTNVIIQELSFEDKKRKKKFESKKDVKSEKTAKKAQKAVEDVKKK